MEKTFYIMLVEFNDGELITITQNEYEDVEKYIEELRDYISQIIVIIKCDVLNGDSKVEVLKHNMAV